MSQITVSEAYGRDYKSKAAVLNAWNANRDFVIRSLGHHAYINKADADAQKIGITFRYDKDRKAFVHKAYPTPSQ